MRTNIKRSIIDTDKLSEQIGKYEIITNQQAYLFMHRSTIDCLENMIPANELRINNSSCRFTDTIAMFQGRKVYIDDDLKFGEVEIR